MGAAKEDVLQSSFDAGYRMLGAGALKLQYFGHLMRRVDSLEKTLILEGLGAGGEGDDRG